MKGRSLFILLVAIAALLPARASWTVVRHGEVRIAVHHDGSPRYAEAEAEAEWRRRNNNN